MNRENKFQEIILKSFSKNFKNSLFGLYVICAWMKQSSSFLEKVFSFTWGLSTSQTPSGQLKYMTKEHGDNNCCPGGGFGPVDPNGYGVSYLINLYKEDMVNFHVSSQFSCANTDSQRFAGNIQKAMRMIAELLEN